MKKTLFLTSKSILVAFSLIAVCAFSNLLLRAQASPETNDQMTGQTEAQGDAKKKDDTPKCTLETLKGRYLFAASGPILPPAFGVTQPTPGANAGFNIFNGDGTGTAIVTLRVNGIIVLENFVTPIS